MLRVAVLVSGGGTNLQAIIDAVKDGTITNTELVAVISNNANAYALTRAKENGIEALCISPKDYADRADFHKALLEKINELKVDLIVLAGYLVKIPEEMVHQYSHRIINIHPSLIPSFCGVGYYGLHVHEAVLEKGVKVTGATVHYVDEGMDTGEIIAQKPVMVEEGDTPEILQTFLPTRRRLCSARTAATTALSTVCWIPWMRIASAPSASIWALAG